jgi:maltose phosphorylase
MPKTADRYLEIHPWTILERGFHPDRAEISESLFSLANEYQGARGFFDEGYSGQGLIGVYVNGVYEEKFGVNSAYKGISNRLAFMVNTVNWLWTRLEMDGETLDLHHSRFEGFTRQLDFRSGELRRELICETASGKRLRVSFCRLISMSTKELAYQQVRLTPLNFNGRVTLKLGLDFSVPHRSFGENFWTIVRQEAGALLGVTPSVGQSLFAGMNVQAVGERTPLRGERFEGIQLDVDLHEGQPWNSERCACLYSPRLPRQPNETVWAAGMDLLEGSAKSYDLALQENRNFWDGFWARSDILIDGDPETQQGIRYCLFQLGQTYRGILPGSNIGAKGLTGEAYNGNAFWDTETYCLPFYLFTNPSAARSLLDFRYQTLPQALQRAQDLDCEGACFPVATSDGTESCTLWQHASLQLQPTTAVAYAIAHYVNVSGDVEYLRDRGMAMLVQICRFLASRGQWSPQGKFGYYAVMGPDEFQMMVNNNAYTNYMAKRTFEYTLAALADMDRTGLGVTQVELDSWRRMAAEMILPCDPSTGIFEQHEGFFNLPHIDVDAIPVEEFPLYHHWSYDRIYRNDMIKQPDVLMFMLLYNQSFSLEQKRANYDYYEPRCIHESSLSPSVHSILAAELGRNEAAFEFFRFATRIDLDNYNRNTHEGIHMTSIAAAWMNIVYGFGGMRSDGDLLSFQPTIPAHWQGYHFQVVYRGAVLRLDISHEEASIRAVEGGAVRVRFYGQARNIDREGVTVAL